MKKSKKLIFFVLTIFLTLVFFTKVQAEDSRESKIRVFSNSRDKLLVYKEDGSLWINKSGQSLTKLFDFQGIKDIAVGIDHFIILKSDGSVWTWGSNNYGQLGYSGDSQLNIPRKIDGLDNVIQISTYYNTSFALKANGEVLAWGYNGYWNNLGVDKSDEYIYTPTSITALDNIKKITCVRETTFALTNDGELYSWGYNGSGEAGLGDNTKVVKPTKLPNINEKVVDFYVGRSVGFAKNENGELWCFGNGANGNLGTGKSQVGALPTKIANLDGITKVLVGESVLALKNDGTVFGWGKNDTGILGNGSFQSNYIPSKISWLNNIGDITLDSEEHYEDYAYAKDINGNIYVWGSSVYAPSLKIDILKSMGNATVLPDSYFIKNDTVWKYNSWSKRVENFVFGEEPIFYLQDVPGIYSKFLYFHPYIESGSKLYYTTDGTNPTNSSDYITQYQEVALNKSTNLKFFVVDSKNLKSRLYEESYYITDINLDNVTDVLDMAEIASRYNQYKGDKNWGSLYDINLDGVIDLYDLTMISSKLYYMEDISDSYITLYKNQDFKLPTTFTVAYSDGSKKELEVIWSLNNIDTSKLGNQKIVGTIKNTNKAFYMNINIIEKQDIVFKKTNKFITDYNGFYYYSNPRDGNIIYKRNYNGTIDIPINRKAIGTDMMIQDDWVYLNVHNDNGPSSQIVRMKVDGSSLTILKSGLINFYGIRDGWIYYTKSEFNMYSASLYKMKLDGTSNELITEDSCYNITFKEEYIYYSNSKEDNIIYKIKYDGTNRTKLSTEKVYEYYGSMDSGLGNLLFIKNNGNTESIHKLSITDSEKSRPQYMWLPIDMSSIKKVRVYGDRVYFLGQSLGRQGLYSCNIFGGDLRSLTSKNIKDIDFINDKIYIDSDRIYELDINTYELKEF